MARYLHRIILALAILTCAPSVFAQTFSVGGGIFVGIQLDKGEPGFTWGAELFSTHYLQGAGTCSPSERLGLGPLVQFALRGESEPRLTFAIHGGGELVRSLPSPRLDGELGGTFFFRDARFALHTGLLFEVAPLFNLAIRHEMFRNLTAVTAGVRILPTYGDAGYCIAD